MIKDEVLERALKEPQLKDALVVVAIWETERIVAQYQASRDSGSPTGAGGALYDTCFHVLFEDLLERWRARDGRDFASEEQEQNLRRAIPHAEDWWWVVVGGVRVAGFAYSDAAGRWGKENYRDRYSVAQGTPDHLATARDRAEDAWFERKRSVFTTLTPQERERELNRARTYLDAIRPDSES